MNIDIIPRTSCTGCMACSALCPFHCIGITADEEGFIIPHVEETKCANCNLCVSHCPSQNGIGKNVPLHVFAFQAKDRAVARSSSSGGAAALITNEILRSHGIVYGCTMDENLKVRHIRITHMEERQYLTGSKYVQSNFSDVYRTIKQDCESGRPVCVFGTPCQIAGVRSFFSKDCANLFFVDLICHGVPSQWLFDEYLAWKAKQMNGERILSYVFRDKTKYDWGTTYRLTTATATATATADPFYQSFIYAKTYRESCYQCKYATVERVGDITVGDYWGILKEHPEWKKKCKDGVSAVLVNTEKGQALFNKIAGHADVTESTIEKASAQNSNLYTPAKRPELRGIYYRSVKEYGFSWANKMMYADKRYYVALIKRMIPMSVKKLIKNLLSK